MVLRKGGIAGPAKQGEWKMKKFVSVLGKEMATTSLNREPLKARRGRKLQSARSILKRVAI